MAQRAQPISGVPGIAAGTAVVAAVLLAFLGIGLRAEARAVAELFRAHQLEVVSVMCMVGVVPKEFLGLADEDVCRQPVDDAELASHSAQH